MPKAAKVAIVAVCALAAAFCVGSYAIDRYLLGQVYARYTPDGPSLMLTDADIAADYPYDDVEFSMDGATLRGHVYGAGDACGLVVFRHGIGSQHQDYLALVTALVDRGWKVFAYDAIGCGESDGDAVGGLARSPLDVHAAVRFARESGIAGGLPVVLVGHSWGGYGVAGALDFGDDVAACVTMSGFDTPTGIIMDWARSNMGPIAATQLPFIELIGRLDFGADADRSAARAIDASGIPVLVVHGTGDAVVGFGASSIIAQAGAITNPQVSYLVEDDESRNGHSTYFYSPESQTYFDECSEALAAFEEAHGGQPTDEEVRSFMQGVDKRRANTADPGLMDAIDGFLSDAVGAGGGSSGGSGMAGEPGEPGEPGTDGEGRSR